MNDLFNFFKSTLSTYYTENDDALENKSTPQSTIDEEKKEKEKQIAEQKKQFINACKNIDLGEEDENFKFIQKYIKNGFDLNIKDNFYSNTGLHYACKNENYKLTLFLIENNSKLLQETQGHIRENRLKPELSPTPITIESTVPEVKTFIRNFFNLHSIWE